MARALRAGILGFGVSGRVFHAPFLAADPAYSLDAIVTSDPARAADAAARHPRARVLPDAEALWESAGDLDLVVVGTPPATHVPLATAALDAGLHVVVDKPFTVSSADGRALMRHAARRGRLLTVFQNRRWDGDFLTVRALRDAGELGEVRRFESRFEWFKPEVRAGWKARATPAEGGGILYDLGTHLLDQAIQLFGDVDGVYAELAAHRAEGQADDDAFVALQHTSGTVSHLWMNSLAPQFGPRFHVLGSKAGYTVSGLDGQEAALAAGALPSDEDYGLTPPEGWGTFGTEGALTEQPTRRGDYGAFYRLLAAALTDGGPPPVEPGDAVRVLELIERIHRGTPLRRPATSVRKGNR